MFTISIDKVQGREEKRESKAPKSKVCFLLMTCHLGVILQDSWSNFVVSFHYYLFTTMITSLVSYRIKVCLKVAFQIKSVCERHSDVELPAGVTWTRWCKLQDTSCDIQGARRSPCDRPNLDRSSWHVFELLPFNVRWRQSLCRLPLSLYFFWWRKSARWKAGRRECRWTNTQWTGGGSLLFLMPGETNNPRVSFSPQPPPPLQHLQFSFWSAGGSQPGSDGFSWLARGLVLYLPQHDRNTTAESRCGCMLYFVYFVSFRFAMNFF